MQPHTSQQLLVVLQVCGPLVFGCSVLPMKTTCRFIDRSTCHWRSTLLKWSFRVSAGCSSVCVGGGGGVFPICELLCSHVLYRPDTHSNQISEVDWPGRPLWHTEGQPFWPGVSCCYAHSHVHHAYPKCISVLWICPRTLGFPQSYFNTGRPTGESDSGMWCTLWQLWWCTVFTFSLFAKCMEIVFLL